MSAYENIPYDTSKFIFLSKPILIARLLTVVKEILVEQPKIISKLEWTIDTEYNAKFTNITLNFDCPLLKRINYYTL